MKYESELQLAKIKSEIFGEIFDAKKARVDENKVGIVHQSECFSQTPPWEK